MAPMRGLYPIVDLDTLAARGLDPLSFAEQVLSARPALLQLRAKRQTPRAVLGLLHALRPLCRAAGTLLFANDRPDLALLAEADGVHIGQEDLPLDELRKLPGRLKVGVSTHDLEQLQAALESRPDYVAFGPVFATRSKALAEPSVGLAALGEASRRAAAAGVPLVAIGGITLDRAPLVLAAGADSAAVITDIVTSQDPKSRTQNWLAATSPWRGLSTEYPQGYNFPLPLDRERPSRGS